MAGSAVTLFKAESSHIVVTDKTLEATKAGSQIITNAKGMTEKE
jgi:hypothetical protein